MDGREGQDEQEGHTTPDAPPPPASEAREPETRGAASDEQQPDFSDDDAGFAGADDEHAYESDDAEESEEDLEAAMRDYDAAEGHSRPRRDSEAPWGRSRFPDLLRKGIEKGIETGLNTWEKSLETGLNTWEKSLETSRETTQQVRERLQDGKLPREMAGAIFNQIEDTKNGVLRVVAKEVRDFLEATDVASELKAALTSLSFEIKTEVRFIPNDAGTGVKPDIKSATSVKVEPEERHKGRRRRRRGNRKSAQDDAPEE